MNCIHRFCTAEVTHEVSLQLTADILGIELELPLCQVHAHQLTTLKELGVGLRADRTQASVEDINWIDVSWFESQMTEKG